MMQRNNTLYRVTTSKDVVLDEAAAMGILQHLDKDMLQQLNDGDQKLLDLVNDQQQVRYFFTHMQISTFGRCACKHSTLIHQISKQSLSSYTCILL